MPEDTILPAASEMKLSNLLEVILTPAKRVLDASDIPTLRATVQNTAPYPITILTYNTLLDKAAGVLGIIHLIDRATGKEAAFDVVKFQRVWPPSQDAFIEIAPNDRRAVEITMRTHKLEAGKKFDVVASWAWQGLWKGGVDIAMEACSAGHTAAGLCNGPTTEVKIDSAFEFDNL